MKKRPKKSVGSSSSGDDTSLQTNHSTQMDDNFIDQIINDQNFNKQDFAAQLNELERSLFADDNDSQDMAVMPVVRPVYDPTNTLTELESIRLQELLEAVATMENEPSCYVYKLNDYVESCITIKKNIKHLNATVGQASKKLTLFNQLCPEDQNALIRYSGFELGLIRQVSGYNQGSKSLSVKGVFIFVNSFSGMTKGRRS